jgi:hypothetical protein
LKKCDFLTEKLGIKPDPDPNDLFRIRILQKVPDPDPQHCSKESLLVCRPAPNGCRTSPDAL